MARDGYVLRFTGKDATSALLDLVLDEIERCFSPGEVWSEDYQGRGAAKALFQPSCQSSICTFTEAPCGGHIATYVVGGGLSLNVTMRDGISALDKFLHTQPHLAPDRAFPGYFRENILSIPQYL